MLLLLKINSWIIDPNNVQSLPWRNLHYDTKLMLKYFSQINFYLHFLNPKRKHKPRHLMSDIWYEQKICIRFYNSRSELFLTSYRSYAKKGRHIATASYLYIRVHAVLWSLLRSRNVKISNLIIHFTWHYTRNDRPLTSSSLRLTRYQISVPRKRRETNGILLYVLCRPINGWHRQRFEPENDCVWPTAH